MRSTSTPGYVDVAVERWQAMTGQPAVLEGEDRTFDDIAAARGVQAAWNLPRS